VVTSGFAGLGLVGGDGGDTGARRGATAEAGDTRMAGETDLAGDGDAAECAGPALGPGSSVDGADGGAGAAFPGAFFVGFQASAV
jgi:hypothetical protein